MKVYVLTLTSYNVNEGIDTYVEGVFSTKEKAKKEMERLINNNINEFDYVRDLNVKKENYARLFYRFDENWDMYIELTVEEMEVQ